MALTSGPFNLSPGETQEMVVALVGGLGEDRLNSITVMKENIEEVKKQYGKPLLIPKVSYVTAHPNSSTSTLFFEEDLGDFEAVTNSSIILKPEAGLDEIIIDLYDNGSHGDRIAGDKIWSNILLSQNKKYPFSGTLNFTSENDLKVYENYLEGIRLRPLPELKNWQVIWENAVQDLKINNRESVHLQFDISNKDLVNDIDTLTIIKQNSFEYTNGIGSGQTIPSDPLFFLLTGPDTGDSLTFWFQLFFDHHTGIYQATVSVTPWQPGESWQDTIAVEAIKGTTENTLLLVADPADFTGHTYLITFSEDTTLNNLFWSLKDESSNEVKIDNLEVNSDPNFAHPVVDGILFKISDVKEDFKSFQVVSNANGPLEPPEGAAADFQGFPSLGPTENQQVGTGIWLFHAGGSDGSYNSGSGSSFLDRAMRGNNFDRAIPFDWEMRFTARGSWAVRAFEDGLAKSAFRVMEYRNCHTR